jgi:hypothetical protein
VVLGAGDLPREDAARVGGGLDPERLALLGHAPLAGAERANEPAGVAAHAARELRLPERPPLGGRHRLKLRDPLLPHRLAGWRRRYLAHDVVGEVRLAHGAAGATPGDVLRAQGPLVRGVLYHTATAHADEDDILALHLRLAQQARHRSRIARLHHDGGAPEAFHVRAAGREVGGEVVDAARIEDEFTRVLEVGDGRRPRTRRAFLPADDNLDLPFAEQRLREVLKLFHSCLPTALPAATGASRLSS